LYWGVKDKKTAPKVRTDLRSNGRKECGNFFPDGHRRLGGERGGKAKTVQAEFQKMPKIRILRSLGKRRRLGDHAGGEGHPTVL